MSIRAVEDYAGVVWLVQDSTLAINITWVLTDEDESIESQMRQFRDGELDYWPAL